jgi:ferric-dicitrate binding protein FerR (iron transport regulator)
MKMIPQEHIPHHLFAKFFAGEITEKEQKELDLFIAEHPDNEQIFHEYELIWSANTDNLDFEDRTEKALDSVNSILSKESRQIKSKNISFVIFKAVASIVLVFGVGYLAFHLFLKDDSKYITLNSQNEIIETKLSDGSTVWLNKNSKLEYPDKFERIRRVKLSGEAYFSVTHNPDIPFVVETGTAETRVLGTEFNLNAPEGSEQIELILTKGKVKFTDHMSGKMETLNMNEQIIFNTKTKTLLKKPYKDINAISWKTGSLNFDQMALEEIVPVLEKVYNKQIRLDNEVKDKVFHQTLAFEKMPLNEILDILRFSLNVQIDSTSTSIIIK